MREDDESRMMYLRSMVVGWSSVDKSGRVSKYVRERKGSEREGARARAKLQFS